MRETGPRRNSRNYGHPGGIGRCPHRVPECRSCLWPWPLRPRPRRTGIPAPDPGGRHVDRGGEGGGRSGPAHANGSVGHPDRRNAQTLNPAAVEPGGVAAQHGDFFFQGHLPQKGLNAVFDRKSCTLVSRSLGNAAWSHHGNEKEPEENGSEFHGWFLESVREHGMARRSLRPAGSRRSGVLQSALRAQTRKTRFCWRRRETCRLGSRERQRAECQFRIHSLALAATREALFPWKIRVQTEAPHDGSTPA